MKKRARLVRVKEGAWNGCTSKLMNGRKILVCVVLDRGLKLLFQVIFRSSDHLYQQYLIIIFIYSIKITETNHVLRAGDVPWRHGGEETVSAFVAKLHRGGTVRAALVADRGL